MTAFKMFVSFFSLALLSLDMAKAQFAGVGSPNSLGGIPLFGSGSGSGSSSSSALNPLSQMILSNPSSIASYLDFFRPQNPSQETVDIGKQLASTSFGPQSSSGAGSGSVFGQLSGNANNNILTSIDSNRLTSILDGPDPLALSDSLFAETSAEDLETSLAFASDPVVQLLNRKTEQVNADDQLLDTDGLTPLDVNDYIGTYATLNNVFSPPTYQMVPFRTAMSHAVARFFDPVRDFITRFFTGVVRWMTPTGYYGPTSARDGSKARERRSISVVHMLLKKLSNLLDLSENKKPEPSATLPPENLSNATSADKESKLFIPGPFSTKKPTGNEILPFWRTLFGPNRNLSDSTVAYSWMYLGILIMFMSISLITGTSYVYYVTDDDIEEYKKNEKEALISMSVNSAVEQTPNAVTIDEQNLDEASDNGAANTGFVLQPGSSELSDNVNTNQRVGDTRAQFARPDTPQLEPSSPSQWYPYPVHYVKVVRERKH